MQRLTVVFSEVLMLVLGTATMLITGCGSGGSGIITDAGIRDPKDVEYVIYQMSSWSKPRQPVDWPLERPQRTTERTAISSFFAAVDQPETTGPARTYPNNRLGFVACDGRVVVFPVEGYTEGCESCNADLTEAKKMAFEGADRQGYDDTSVPSTPIDRIVYQVFNNTGGTDLLSAKAGSLPAGLESVWGNLLGTYNPLSLGGNTRCGKQDMQGLLTRYPEHLKTELKSPQQFDCIVLNNTLDSEWPPKTGYASGRLEKVRCDAVYVLRLQKDIRGVRPVRFIFEDTHDSKYLLTAPVDPRSILGYDNSTGMPHFSADLFDQLVSTLRSS